MLATPGRLWPAYRSEVLPAFVFDRGVAGSGIVSFFSHFFMADIVAQSIGWEAGSPVQLEIAFSNLPIGAGGFALGYAVCLALLPTATYATVAPAVAFSLLRTIPQAVANRPTR